MPVSGIYCFLGKPDRDVATLTQCLLYFGHFVIYFVFMLCGGGFCYICRALAFSGGKVNLHHTSSVKW